MNHNDDNIPQDSATPYNLENDNNDPATTPPPPVAKSDRTPHFLILVAAVTFVLGLTLWLTLGWHTSVVVLAIIFWGVVLYLLAFMSEVISPFWIYNQIAKAKLKVIQEPRLYTQDDMALENTGNSGDVPISTRDWASASGAYIELDGFGKEIQLVFASPVSRPVGRFWSKPRSLLWTLSGYGSDFAVKEGLISETGKCYWVQKHDFEESGTRILRLVQGTWNYETNEFVGDYVDSNGTMGSYPTLAKQK